MMIEIHLGNELLCLELELPFYSRLYCVFTLEFISCTLSDFTFQAVVKGNNRLFISMRIKLAKKSGKQSQLGHV